MTEYLHVLSYNIHKGMTAGNARLVLSDMRNSLRSLPIDIVFLQEVVGGEKTDETTSDPAITSSQFEYLADSIWSHFSYGKNSVSSKGHFGNAILSKFPIRSFSNADISTNRFEKRGMLYAEIELPESNDILHCFNVHLNLVHRGRAHQTKKICELIKSKVASNDKIILAGDFNDWPSRLSILIENEIAAHESFKCLHGSYATTYPSYFPILKLDRIYARNLRCHSAILLNGKKWAKLSDHLPLYCEFMFKD